MSTFSAELLGRIRERAPGYDAANAFFDDDLAELREAGYLVPRSLLEASRDQRLLAAHAPATALAVNMHLVWTTVARVLADRGDPSLAWLLEEATAGELFGFGISEAGNDSVLFDSRTIAEPRADGSYAFTGTKIFTSLAPAWTRLGIFGRDDSDPLEPRLVHGFISRDTPGHRHLGDWDALGMRATQSHTTVLEGAVVPADRVTRILPVGPNPDPFVFGIFAGFETLIAAVYAGIADRALELATTAVQRRTSLKNAGASYALDADIRWQLADAAIALDALAPQIEAVARDVDGVVDHGGKWFRLLVGLKTRAAATAREVVGHAVRVSGGGSYAADGELARLYRDVLAGDFHPSDPESAHATVATNLLGPLP